LRLGLTKGPRGMRKVKDANEDYGQTRRQPGTPGDTRGQQTTGTDPEQTGIEKRNGEGEGPTGIEKCYDGIKI